MNARAGIDAPRMRMRLALAQLASDPTGGWSGPAHPLAQADLVALGDLAYEAYRGSVDDRGETRAWHLAEMEATWAGRYGPVQPASLVVTADHRLVAAVVITSWNSHPLLAFALTHPTMRGRGVASGLIRRSAARLLGAGADELRLAVTATSPAVRLYRRLGFVPL